MDIVEVILLAIMMTMIVGLVAWYFPQADAQYRFMMRDAVDGFGDNSSGELVFAQQQIDLVNDVASTSIGPDPAGDERQFCFREKDGVVTMLRFSDNISKSTQDSVSGSCERLYSSDGFEGWLHSQPGYSDQLSEEDKDIESPEPVEWTCVMFDEVVEVNGEVGGLNCWRVSGPESDLSFEEVDVGVTSRPDLVPS
jgi:proteasome lid subunit RPN8/RPN11